MIKPTLINLFLIILIFQVNDEGYPFVQTADERFIKINNSNLFINIQGKGSPTVIFISGAGEDHNTWNEIQHTIAERTQTLSYDRSGLGKSDNANNNKDAVGMAEELNLIIEKLNLDTKYILVAHSLGCQIARVYISKFNTPIIGIIYIDPGINEDSVRAVLSKDEWNEREKMIFKYTPPMNLAQSEEIRLINISCVEADTSEPIFKINTVLFTATKYNPNFPGAEKELDVKKRSHENWIKQTPYATHKFNNKSRHYIQNENPEVIIETIEKLLN